MKKTAKKATARMGRPPKQGESAALKSLGSVRVSPERLDAYTGAAALAGKARADWIRDTLDAAVVRAMKRAVK